ncbi:unnamed protein product [Polarella glacialis]|uniref:Cyclic nucleotide-binding domain-containing protein n=1 Tax=Polarella glacialis TaxID=89957 RepID=A0A813DKN5_POLGL|nr:unnamed protein product [Polarella glacialis]
MSPLNGLNISTNTGTTSGSTADFSAGPKRLKTGSMSSGDHLLDTLSSVSAEEDDADMLHPWGLWCRDEWFVSSLTKKTKGRSKKINKFEEIDTIMEGGVRQSSSRGSTAVPAVIAQNPSILQCCVTAPGSDFRVVWGALGIFCILYDCICVPLLIFDFEYDTAIVVTRAITTAYWISDCLNSFFQGYHKQGILEMRLHHTARHYAKTWFPMNLVITSIDVASFCIIQSAGLDGMNAKGSCGSACVVSYLSIFRLLRLIKMPYCFTHVESRLVHNLSETQLELMSLFKRLVEFIFVIHVIACFWFGIYRWTGDTADSWVQSFTQQHDEKSYLYLTALQWSMAQFTFASTEIVPRNLPERIYASVAIIVGLVAFSAFLSSVIGSMAHLRQLRSHQRAQETTLRKFLTEQNCPPQLTMRIWRIVGRMASQRKQYTDRKDVAALAIIPENLMMELNAQIYYPVLSVHPLFRQLGSEHDKVFEKLCHLAVSDVLLSTEQDLFNPRTRAEYVYFVARGELLYQRGSIEDGKDSEFVAKRGTWLSEAAIWMPWEHNGRAVAVESSSVVAIAVDKFQSVMRTEYGAWPGACKYAKLFVQHANALRISDQEFTDIWVNQEQMKEMVRIAFEEDTVPVMRVVDPSEFTNARRMLIFFDMSTECDDECALLWLVAALNAKNMVCKVELVMCDSHVRFQWMAHLFKEKMSKSGEWAVRGEGSVLQIGTVLINLYLAFAPGREMMVISDIKKKAPDLQLTLEEYEVDDAKAPGGKKKMKRAIREKGKIGGPSHDMVPGGDLACISVAGAIPDIDPAWFERFTNVNAVYVVGTPGGVNCPAPSWANLSAAMHKIAPVLYLTPQFTRAARFPRMFVLTNPYWNDRIKNTVLDAAVTNMARRPEIPAMFGNWGLLLRLNFANATFCRDWYQDATGKSIEEAEKPANIVSMVKAYVDRNSGEDRKPGALVNELKAMGIDVAKALGDAWAGIDDKGMPTTDEAKEALRAEYRLRLYEETFACVITSYTLLFNSRKNWRSSKGQGNFEGMEARCGYRDPMNNLAGVFGPQEAINIIAELPLKHLTPAYDVVSMICMVSALNTDRGYLDLGLKIEPADSSMGRGLLTAEQMAYSEHPVLMTGTQTDALIDSQIRRLVE